MQTENIQIGGYDGEMDLPDLESILKMVKRHGVSILTPEELDIYNAHIEETKTTVDGFYDNLAVKLSEKVLSKIAQDVVNWTEWDEESRKDWQIREKKGIRMLGVSDMTDGGATFEGASKVVHPLLIEAAIQFQARAVAELMPQSGVVRSVVLGYPTPEIQEQANRVEDYLNYLYQEKMPGAFEEMDAMLFRLPLSGSCFKKIYYDPILDVPCSRFVKPSDFIVPFTATDLESAARFTHRQRENANSIRKKIAMGFYSGDSDSYTLNNSANESRDYPDVESEIDRTEGKSRVQNNDNDERHTVLECYIDLDIEGLEDKDALGKKTNIALPYIVTVDRDLQKVLRITRNYRIDDKKREKIMYFTHYKFSPGLGFYGYGLLHMIGGLANSATGALRALLDSAQFANQQGGFTSQDSKMEAGDTPIAPGEWRRVKSSAEELSKAFYPLPAKEPSGVLFNLLSYLDDKAQRVASTTDSMVGDVPANMPVGTALQNQENGSKVFSAIHLRLHNALSKEFRILAKLVSDYLPEEGYPYLVKGAEKSIIASDFDGRVDVIPVSDPNLISNSHRIAQAQGYIDLAKQFPGIINPKLAVKKMLEAMRSQDIEALMTLEESDGVAEQLQAKQIEKLNAEIAKLTANANREQGLADKVVSDKLKVEEETVGIRVKSTYEAIQTLISTIQASQQTGADIASAVDAFTKSLGLKDQDTAPLLSVPQADQAPVSTVPQNTSPQYPPVPQQALPQETPPPPPTEQANIEESPATGIETTQFEQPPM